MVVENICQTTLRKDRAQQIEVGRNSKSLFFFFFISLCSYVRNLDPCILVIEDFFIGMFRKIQSVVVTVPYI